MLFALNYSPEAAALLQAGHIDIDRFKCPDWPDMIATARQFRPVYVHFPLKAGTDTGDPPDLNRIEKLLVETDTPYVNVHALVQSHDLPGVSPDNVSPEVVEQVTSRIICDVEVLVSRFGADRVIVENLYYPDAVTDLILASTLPEVLCEVTNETGCGFLLDIAHARIASLALSVHPQDYIRELPLHRLQELHVTGAGLLDGRMRDHLPMKTVDWSLFTWLMQQPIRPDFVTCEYGGTGPYFGKLSDPDVIREQIPRMAAAVRQADHRRKSH